MCCATSWNFIFVWSRRWWLSHPSVGCTTQRRLGMTITAITFWFLYGVVLCLQMSSTPTLVLKGVLNISPSLECLRIAMSSERAEVQSSTSCGQPSIIYIAIYIFVILQPFFISTSILIPYDWYPRTCYILGGSFWWIRILRDAYVLVHTSYTTCRG